MTKNRGGMMKYDVFNSAGMYLNPSARQQLAKELSDEWLAEYCKTGLTPRLEDERGKIMNLLIGALRGRQKG